jgi:hypothetical protein
MCSFDVGANSIRIYDSFLASLRLRFSSFLAIFFKKDSPFLMQQVLYFSPEPQGQGSLRPTFRILRGAVTTLLRKLIFGEIFNLLLFPRRAISFYLSNPNKFIKLLDNFQPILYTAIPIQCSQTLAALT